MIEREMKLLVDKSEFDNILEIAKRLYSDITPKTISQTNYYYDTEDLALYNSGVTLRVREKNGTFMLEQKINRSYESDGSRIAEEKKTPIDTLPQRINDYDLLGQLSTLRTRYTLPDGTNIDFDISQYFDITDYEIEIELGEKAPDEFLAHLPAVPMKPDGKYPRFLAKKIALTSKGENKDE